MLLLLLGGFLAHGERYQRAGRNICFVVGLLFFLIAIFPTGSWALLPLENKFPPQKPEHVAGIILLGGDEKRLGYTSQAHGLNAGFSSISPQNPLV